MKKSKKIRKEYVILVILLLCIPVAHATLDENADIDNFSFHTLNDGDSEWNREFGSMDFPGTARDIQQTTDGGYIITGLTGPYGKGWNAWLIKINEDGSEVWNKTFGGIKEDWANSVIEKEDGYIIGGYTKSFGSGEEDFWLIQTDKYGNEIWNKTYGERFSDLGIKTIETRDEGYAMVGYSSQGELPPDIRVLKTDKDGVLQWSRTYGGEGTEFGDAILEISNGYLISGITSTYATHGSRDAWLVSIDKQGNEQWNKTYGWGGYEFNAYVSDIEEGYIIAGYSEVTPVGEGNAYIIKTDKNGNEVWNKTHGGHGIESIGDITKTNDGYILVGSTETYDVGLFDAWLLKVDKNGNEIWNKSFGGRGRDIANAVIADNSYYIIAGEKGYHSNSVDWANAWIIKSESYPPPKIEIMRPMENYLYLFDREIMPFYKTLVIGGITIDAELYNPLNTTAKRVEFYLVLLGRIYDYEPRSVVYYPPYEWRWDESTVALLRPAEITVGGYYGNAGGVAVDKIDVRIFNP